MHLYLVPGILDTPEPGDTLYLVPGVPYAFLLGARCLRHPRTWCQVSHVHFHLVLDVLDTPNLVPGVPYGLFFGARYLRYPKTWCQVSHMHFYLVPGVLDTPEPDARCSICTYTWCQVS